MKLEKFLLFEIITIKTETMIDILRNRRSIRKYTKQPIEQEKLEILKEAALRSPSSKNINPWEFIFVDDKETIGRLKDCKAHGIMPLKTAPLAIVVCAAETKNDVWIEDCSIASIKRNRCNPMAAVPVVPHRRNRD